MTISLGIAYGHAYGTAIGLIVGTLSTVLVISSLFLNAPTISVDDRVVRVGKARLPLEFAGDVRHLNQESTKSALRDNAHHQAYLLVRSWIPESLIITVTDEQDPHPYWHISSRNIPALLAAIESAKIGSGGSNGQE